MTEERAKSKLFLRTKNYEKQDQVAERETGNFEENLKSIFLSGWKMFYVS